MAQDDFVEQYRRDGYVLHESLLTTTQLRELRQVTDEIVGRARNLARSDTILDLHDTHTAADPRVRRIKNAHRQHPFFADLIRSDAILDPLRCLLGPNIRLHSSKLNLKSAGDGDAIEWHRDWAFYPHTNDDLLAIGVFLDDVDLDNAPLLVVPGSHRGPIHDHHAKGAFVGAVDVVAAGVDVTGATAITGRAGSMSIHHVRALHGSAVNRSDRQRRILFYELAAADAWPLMGKGQIGDGSAAAYDAWFNGMMVSGSPTTQWRMVAAPVRVPFPDAYAGASSADGTIYKAQAHLPNRYFSPREPAQAGPTHDASSIGQ